MGRWGGGGGEREKLELAQLRQSEAIHEINDLCVQVAQPDDRTQRAAGERSPGRRDEQSVCQSQ